MSILASKVLEVAENEVGYLEKRNANNLDSKTENVGDANYTKYGRDMVKWVGNPYTTHDAWCDTFTDWCFVTAYGKQIAMSLLNGWSAYTPTSAQYFKNIGQWFEHNPKAGDLIFFKNNVRICHVGLVYKVDATKVYTIEGNTSSKGTDVIVENGGGVFKKSYTLNNPRIAGYGRPKYTDEPKAVIPQQSKYIHGIDISACQGDIDFGLVKQSGVKFAVLRVTTKNNEVDPYFEKYYKGCITYQMTPAVYKYSYARTEEEALEEANKVLEVLGTRKPNIWYDLENNNQLQEIGKDGIDKVAKMFLETCRRNGHKVGIYCSLNWYRNYISKDLKDKYPFWLARYGTNNGLLDESYKPNLGEVGWQYTSRGRVDGIKGDVDLDVMYTRL